MLSIDPVKLDYITQTKPEQCIYVFMATYGHLWFDYGIYGVKVPRILPHILYV